MLTILTPGLQTTLQGAPRSRHRHLGVPDAGPADAWSMALANRLVGNSPTETALEITYGGFEARFDDACWIALAGAPADAALGGAPIQYHETMLAPAGSVLELGSPREGMRIYLAIYGGFSSDTFLGSTSTYLPAEFGGYQGRVLHAGDVISVGDQPSKLAELTTPLELRPVFSRSYALRACTSGEFEWLSPAAQETLFSHEFVIGRQATRMGVSLEGKPLQLSSDGKMKSTAVFPGTIQCPEGGTPIILLADAQTTGGYPRIASIARCDRHLLGQLRPGDRLRLLKRTPAQATSDLDAKRAVLQRWVPEFSL